MTIQRMMSVYFPVIVSAYCFEGFRGGYANLFYGSTGIAALLAAAVCFFSRKLYKYRDVQLLLLISLMAWISSVVSFGFSIWFFLSSYFTNWVLLLSLYFIMRSSEEPDALLFKYARLSAAVLSALCLISLAYATSSLTLPVPTHDRTYGSFQLGRFTAMGNANSIGRCCFALIILSVFCILRVSGKHRLPYCASALIGWFCLGLTNSRSAIICVSFSLGLIAFFIIMHRSSQSGRNKFLRSLMAAAAAVLVFLIAIESFYIPTPAYRLIVTGYAKASGEQYLLANISIPSSRDMTSDLETMGDRILIWDKCIESVFSTPRRTWLGISHINADRIPGVYPGHHEILTVNAHNIVFELLMMEGVTGLLIWLILIIMWCAKGIKILFDPSAPVSARYISAAAAAILLNGTVEAVPFSNTAGSYLSVPFYIFCAWCMNGRRNSK
ncbi:MAG: O-antigen ligase family protein [Firmicutes bacterium]|nr:O-antigen ligase family protein [Bacillota bacterium]MBR0441014.1 O-antigen ligase family protein [Bacillota bacterium]